MVKKSVLLMSVVACGVTLGSGAEAVKKLQQIEGQAKLDQCQGWSTARRQRERDEKKEADAQAKRERDKQKAQKENQEMENWYLKVSTER